MDPPPGLDLALPPFSLLDAAGRARLLDSLDMGFHPAGEILMSAGQPSAHVYVLLKGQARAYDLDQDGREQPFADYGPGEVFGAWAAITGSASYHFRASTVCLSFLIPTPVFRSLVADQPAFAAYFSERLSVRGQLAEPSRPEQAELMLAQAGDAQLAPVERVPAGASIAQAAARLRERQVDCLLVDDPDHPDPGIVTRTDLLEALTLRQLPLDAAVGPPPVNAAEAEPSECRQYHPPRAPEGLLVMTEKGVLTRLTAIKGSSVKTTDGAGVGDDGEALKARYGASARFSPHKYEAAPAGYLTTWPGADALLGTYVADPAARGLVFEIGGDGKVAFIHAGGPSIQYVEGCS